MAIISPLLQVAEKKGLVCGDCGKLFTQLAQAAAHRVAHAKGAKLCPHCPKGFPDPAALLAHLACAHPTA